MKKIIWTILDGKRGHEKQIEDLVFCLKKENDLKIIKINSNNLLKVILNSFTDYFDKCKNYPKPNLIIGAGHSTHFDILQKKMRYGGKAIIIMKPSLPASLFDLVIAPYHDQIIFKENIFITDGPVNRIINRKKQIKNKALILIGGPSKNYIWNNHDINMSIKKVLYNNSQLKFTIGTSRRTPAKFLKNFNTGKENKIKLVDHRAVSTRWLEEEISKSEFSWVTQDSISMVYELIASGSKVTCIALESKNKKFDKLYESLYKSKVINLTNQPIQKIIFKENQKSNATLCADFISNKFLLNEK